MCLLCLNSGACHWFVISQDVRGAWTVVATRNVRCKKNVNLKSVQGSVFKNVTRITKSGDGILSD